MQPSASHNNAITTRQYAILGLALAVFAVIRLWAATDDFLMDEIWTLMHCQRAPSFTWLFTDFKHDNNHLLNSLVVYFIGPQRYWILYRVHSFVFGMFSLVLMSLVASKRGFTEALIALLLGGSSYHLVVHAAEARGYSMAIFFGLLAFVALKAYMRDAKLWKRTLLIYWAAVAFGFLSHLSFGLVFLALVGWSLLREFFEIKHRAYLRAILCHGLPLLFVGWLYFFFAKEMRFAGVPFFSYWEVFGHVFSYALGFSKNGVWGGLSYVLGISSIGFGLWRIFKQERQEALWYALVLLVSPLLVLAISRPPFIFARYFSPCFPFFYLLYARLLASLFKASRLQKTMAGLLLGAYLVGNAFYLKPLLYGPGRASYFQAMVYMMEHTPSDTVYVGSPWKLQDGRIFWYYGRILGHKKKWVYVFKGELPQQHLDWFIVDRTKALALDSEINRIKPTPEIIVRGDFYKLEKYFGSDGNMSGWDWYLYRRQPKKDEKPLQGKALQVSRKSD